MSLKEIPLRFIPDKYKGDEEALRKARILVTASLLTSLFSTTYIGHSYMTSFWAGVGAMIFNALFFLLLPFMYKKEWFDTRTGGYIFVIVGYIGVFISCAFSGGFFSMTYIWFATLPILSVMIIDIKAGLQFTIVSIITSLFIWYGTFYLEGFFPKQIAEADMPLWYVSSYLGVVLIIYIVAYVFSEAQLSALGRISDQNKLIRTQKDKLEASNNTKDRIFAILGHDLRKPAISFRGITKKVNFLLKKERYADLESLGEDIEENAVRLNNMIDNLLHWALTQRGLGVDTIHDFRLHPITEEIIESFISVIENKNISIVNNIGLNHSAYADSHGVRTVLRNLIDNALKYTEAFGVINITAFVEKDFIKIDVSDTGGGIAVDKMEQLFTLYRAKSEKGTQGEKGTGLGLHLVFELVRLNNGRIEVESAIGIGTTFSVYLPKGKAPSVSV